MLRRFVIVLSMLALIGVVGCGQEGLKTGDDNAGFVPLFNGKDLSGWKTKGKASWSVEDGVLVGKQGENNAPGDLFTEGTYKDFEVKVTYKMVWPGNSGIWFRYQSGKKTYQADILKYKKPECYSGTIYCPGKKFLSMNTDKALEKQDDWNEMKIRCEGDRLQIWLNGRQVADVNDKTSDSGTIGFQVHPGDHYGAMRIIVKEVLIRPL